MLEIVDQSLETEKGESNRGSLVQVEPWNLVPEEHSFSSDQQVNKTTVPCTYHRFRIDLPQALGQNPPSRIVGIIKLAYTRYRYYSCNLSYWRHYFLSCSCIITRGSWLLFSLVLQQGQQLLTFSQLEAVCETPRSKIVPQSLA